MNTINVLACKPQHGNSITPYLNTNDCKKLCQTNKEIKEACFQQTKQRIKKNTMEVKSDIIEHLWKVIISDNTIDQYESNLMRRICGLIYFPDKMSAEIKLRLLDTK